ncbi:hypothetical protein GS399_05315 [Pedobacter sp. HMF7647]|uniref:Uncharacterized protein n=1 Tax=Hufsiella arboris TaxID=2695275 RepID=A0A7K1Y738_9SPHI|nr:hypothetical protein [Hufsiella arboris]MXV50384.1 hypothetical protein [Hufsiella arboris]
MRYSFDLKILMRSPRRLSASTIVEVVIAMVIMVTVMLVAVSLIGRLSISGIPLVRIRAQAQAETLASQDAGDGKTGESSWDIGGLRYIRKVSLYKDYTDLRRIQVEAFQNGVQLCLVSRLVKVGDEKNL